MLIMVVGEECSGVDTALDPLMVMSQYLHHLLFGEPPIATASGYSESLGPDNYGVYAPVHFSGNGPGAE